MRSLPSKQQLVLFLFLPCNHSQFNFLSFAYIFPSRFYILRSGLISGALIFGINPLSLNGRFYQCISLVADPDGRRVEWGLVVFSFSIGQLQSVYLTWCYDHSCLFYTCLVACTYTSCECNMHDRAAKKKETELRGNVLKAERPGRKGSLKDNKMSSWMKNLQRDQINYSQAIRCI